MRCFIYTALVLSVISSARLKPCTIAAISGRATADGRPLLWKNRDVGNPEQKFDYFAPVWRDGRQTRGYLGNFYSADTTRIYMGVNDSGFGIMNSDSYNLDDSLTAGIDDGTLMRLALENCTKLQEFEWLLDSTNALGRIDCWNFGVFDSSGRVAIYECGNRHWVAYYADQDSDGILIRANYSMSGGARYSGEMRVKRAEGILRGRSKEGISAAFVLANLPRDLVNEFADPYPLPFNGTQPDGAPGYIWAGSTINNVRTNSAAVIRGVDIDEDPRFSMLLAILGTPVLSVAFPLWVGSANVPIYLNSDTTAPMIQVINQRLPLLYNCDTLRSYLDSRYLLDNEGRGVYTYTLPLERWAVGRADSCQTSWRTNAPSQIDISLAQWRIARRLFNCFLIGTFGGALNQPIANADRDF